MSQEKPGNSTIDIFEQKIRRTTDFGNYVKMLAQEGLPILQEMFKSGPEPDRWMSISIGIMTARVLDNRKENNLPMGTFDLWGNTADKEKLIKELVPDDHLRLTMAKGVILGLEVAGIISPHWHDQIKASFN